MSQKPTYRKTYPASKLEMRRGGGGRRMFTDTHCNTPGYPGTFKPFEMPEERPLGDIWTMLVAAAATFATVMAFFVAGCIA